MLNDKQDTPGKSFPPGPSLYPFSVHGRHRHASGGLRPPVREKAASLLKKKAKAEDCPFLRTTLSDFSDKSVRFFRKRVIINNELEKVSRKLSSLSHKYHGFFVLNAKVSSGVHIHDSGMFLDTPGLFKGGLHGYTPQRSMAEMAARRRCRGRAACGGGSNGNAIYRFASVLFKLSRHAGSCPDPQAIAPCQSGL